MKKDNFFKESLILTISNLATGILGFMFSIILSRELGPEGMGLYGLVMPIYNLFICLICGGMVTAISKVAAVFFSKNDHKSLNKSIKSALSFDLAWGLLVATIFFLASPYISTYIIKDSRTLYPIKIVAPALIFVAMSSILKGYFYGISKVKIPAFIDIFEKAIRIGVIVTLIKLLSVSSVEGTVTIAYTALCVGELVSLLLLSTFYRLNKSKQVYTPVKSEGRAQLLFDILVISFPLCLNGFLSTALGTVSTLIVPRQLVSIGFDYSTALSLIGKFSGMALSITYFPIIVINSITTVLVPDLSQSLSKKDYFALEGRITEVLKIAFLLSMSTLIISTSIPDSLGKLFFSREDLGPYIRFAAFSAPFTYTASTTYGILNGLGKQGILLRNSLLVSLEEVLLLFILTGIPNINIFGYGISLIITSATLLALNIHEIRKLCYITFSPSNLFIDLLLSVFIYFILATLNSLLPSSAFILKNVAIIATGYISFFFFLSLINKESINE